MSINEFKAVVNGGVGINIEEYFNGGIPHIFPCDGRRSKLGSKLYPWKATVLESENSFARREIKLKI